MESYEVQLKDFKKAEQELTGKERVFISQDNNTRSTTIDEIRKPLAEQLNDIANDVCAKGASSLLADNTVIIQEELNKKGHVVISKPGVYLTKGLVIYDNTFFELYPGVELKLIDGTCDYLLRNEYSLTSDTTNKNINIKIKGGTWTGNSTKNQKTGTWLEGKFPGWGILLNHIENVVLEDMFLQDYVKYCFHIINCKNIYTNNIGFNNGSDGIHFQPPLKDAFINNTYGTTGDDMIAFTLGDFPQYVVSQEGNFENIVVDGVNADSCVGFVKITGSGLDSKYLFKNISINNLNGVCTRYIASIIEDRTYDTGGLNKTMCENVSFNHVKASGAKFFIDTYKATLHFNDISIDHYYWFEVNYMGNETDPEVNLIIDNAYSPQGKSIDQAFILLEDKANIGNLILNNCMLKLNAVPLVKILSNSIFKMISMNNVHCQSTGTGGQYIYEDSGNTDEAIILMNNCSFNGFEKGELYHKKIKVRHTNCELLNKSNCSTYLYSGANVKIYNVNSNITGFPILQDLTAKLNDYWINAELQNNWDRHGNSNTRYYKDATNGIHFDCIVTGGAVNTVIFTLPEGYRPKARMWFPVNTSDGTANNNVYGMIQVDTNGDVKFVTGSNAYVGLSNIYYTV